MDRLVEPHLVQVDVEQPGTRRIELILLEHGMVSGPLAVEDDVEDRVQTMVAREDAAELPLLDAERMCLLAAPVEDAGDEPSRAQTTRLRAPTRLAGLDVELDTFTGHVRRPSLAKGAAPIGRRGPRRPGTTRAHGRRRRRVRR